LALSSVEVIGHDVLYTKCNFKEFNLKLRI
jgi:hypothetical protein